MVRSKDFRPQQAPRSYRKKPLGNWPDAKKHEATLSPEEEAEQERSGHMPDPEEVTGADKSNPKTNLDAAQEVGLYTEADEEHPEEVGLGEQINELEDEKKPGHGSE